MLEHHAVEGVVNNSVTVGLYIFFIVFCFVLGVIAQNTLEVFHIQKLTVWTEHFLKTVDMPFYHIGLTYQVSVKLLLFIFMWMLFGCFS